LLKEYHLDIDNTADGEDYEKKIKVLQELVKNDKMVEASKWNAVQMAH
jgi:hypothetical protein